jgi:hypothetical protein
MSRQQQLVFEGLRPPGFDELQIALFIFTVNFVTDDWVSAMCEVNPDLVHASCDWDGGNERKPFLWVRLGLETLQQLETSLCRTAVRVYGLLEPDWRGLVGALPGDWRVNGPSRQLWPSVNEGLV